MENQRPLILVSNGDGIIAKGISELIKFLRPLGEIVVMAPDAPRSGSACALTVTEPIRYQLLRKDVGLTVYKCSGTPADCVKLAFHTVLDRKPDLVVGGTTYSGTRVTCTTGTVASGGSVMERECSRPWLAIGSLSTTPPLPVLLPW